MRELVERRYVLSEVFRNSQSRINHLRAEIDNITRRFEEAGVDRRLLDDRLQFLVNERDNEDMRLDDLQINIYHLNTTLRAFFDRFGWLAAPVGA